MSFDKTRKIRCPICGSTNIEIYDDELEHANIFITRKDKDTINLEEQFTADLCNCCNCGYIMLFKKSAKL